MHSILQTSCDNISSKLQVSVKLLQVIIRQQHELRGGGVENVSTAAPPIGTDVN